MQNVALELWSRQPINILLGTTCGAAQFWSRHLKFWFVHNLCTNLPFLPFLHEGFLTFPGFPRLLYVPEIPQVSQNPRMISRSYQMNFAQHRYHIGPHSGQPANATHSLDPSTDAFSCLVIRAACGKWKIRIVRALFFSGIEPRILYFERMGPNALFNVASPL